MFFFDLRFNPTINPYAFIKEPKNGASEAKKAEKTKGQRVEIQVATKDSSDNMSSTRPSLKM